MLQRICLHFLNILIKIFFWDVSVFKMDDIQLRYQKSLLVNERKRKCGFSRSRTREPWDRKQTRYHCTKISLMEVGQKILQSHNTRKKLRNLEKSQFLKPDVIEFQNKFWIPIFFNIPHNFFFYAFSRAFFKEKRSSYLSKMQQLTEKNVVSK